MTLATLIRRMADAGAPPEAIAIAVEAIEMLEAADEARRERKRTANRERQQRHRIAVTRDEALHERDVTVTSLPKKERVPPTPPLLEKTPTLNFSEADASLVPEVSGTCEIKDLRKDKVTLFQTVVGMWNELATAYRLVSVRDITAPRQAAIIARSEDFVKTYDFPDALAGWRKLMGVVRGSPFLRGELNGFRCDFDFVTKPKSFTSIMEGKYEARATLKR